MGEGDDERGTFQSQEGLKRMRTIYKEPLLITGEQTITLPLQAKILHLDCQRDNVCVWYECDTELPTKRVTIFCYGTGHPIPTDRKQQYLGTVLVEGGDGVFHFYKEIENE